MRDEAPRRPPPWRLVRGALLACAAAALASGCGGEPAAPTPPVELPPGIYFPTGLHSPGSVASLTLFQDVSASSGHTCGIAASQAVHCWGSHALGMPEWFPQRRAYPIAVPGDLVFASVANGTTHTCAATPAGAVYCWGVGSPFGALDGGGSWQTPRRVQTQLPLGGVIAGNSFSCALRQGTAYCWGMNGWGQLGSGTTSSSAAFGAVSGGLTFARLGRTLGETACGITVDAALYCWGRGDRAQLGGTAPEACANGPCATRPLPVFAGVRVSAVATGQHTGCALTDEGAAYCWGLNGDVNSLGSEAVEAKDGALSAVPVRVATAERLTAITVGVDHACGLAADGLAWCWGSNREGQLGASLTAEWSLPVAVQGGPIGGSLRFISIAAGNRYTCGIAAGGRAYCWGRFGDHLGRG